MNACNYEGVARRERGEGVRQPGVVGRSVSGTGWDRGWG